MNRRVPITRLDLCAWVYSGAGVLFALAALLLPDPFRKECGFIAFFFISAGLACSATAIRRMQR